MRDWRRLYREAGAWTRRQKLAVAEHEADEAESVIEALERGETPPIRTHVAFSGDPMAVGFGVVVVVLAVLTVVLLVMERGS